MLKIESPTVFLKRCTSAPVGVTQLPSGLYSVTVFFEKQKDQKVSHPVISVRKTWSIPAAKMQIAYWKATSCLGEQLPGRHREELEATQKKPRLRRSTDPWWTVCKLYPSRTFCSYS